MAAKKAQKWKFTPPPPNEPTREWWYAVDEEDGPQTYGPFATYEARRDAILKHLQPGDRVAIFSGYGVSLEFVSAEDV